MKIGINSQNMAVLGFLLSGHKLTPLSAMHNLKVGRLAARIKDLRSVYGNEAIITTTETVPNSRVRYASYRWNF
jgi:hypothetical protein